MKTDMETLVEELDLYKRREYVMRGRAVEQERELSRVKALVFDWRALQGDEVDSMAPVRQGAVDPSVNMEIKMLRELLHAQEDELKYLRRELQGASASKDSLTWERVVKKARHLTAENEELALAAQTAMQGHQAQTALVQRRLVSALRKLRDSHDFETQLDDENERMAEQTNRLVRKNNALQEENDRLRQMLKAAGLDPGFSSLPGGNAQEAIAKEKSAAES